jgi:hypothetical protein
MTWTQDDWTRLGDRFRASRRNAGYETKEAFAEAVGISTKTYGDLEAGRLGKRGGFSFDTIAKIEDKLGWEPGVSRMLLDGKDVDLYSGIVKPAPSQVQPWGRTSSDDDVDNTFTWLDERVERLEQRLLRVERELRVSAPGHPFGVGPEPETDQPEPMLSAARKGQSPTRAKTKQELDEMTAPQEAGPEFGA